MELGFKSAVSASESSSRDSGTGAQVLSGHESPLQSGFQAVILAAIQARRMLMQHNATGTARRIVWLPSRPQVLRGHAPLNPCRMLAPALPHWLVDPSDLTLSPGRIGLDAFANDRSMGVASRCELAHQGRRRRSPEGLFLGHCLGTVHRSRNFPQLATPIQSGSQRAVSHS